MKGTIAEFEALIEQQAVIGDALRSIRTNAIAAEIMSERKPTSPEIVECLRRIRAQVDRVEEHTKLMIQRDRGART